MMCSAPSHGVSSQQQPVVYCGCGAAAHDRDTARRGKTAGKTGHFHLASAAKCFITRENVYGFAKNPKTIFYLFVS